MNPFGPRLHWHAAATALSDACSIAPALWIPLALALGLAALGGVLALAEKKLAHFLLSALLTAAALRWPQSLPFAAILLLPLANGAITSALRRTRDLRPALRHGVSAVLAYSDRLRLLDRGLSGVWIAPVAALLAFLWMRVPLVMAETGFPTDRLPVIVGGEVATLPPGTRLLAPAEYGSYVIFRTRGDRKVFVDTRGGFYTAAFLRDCARLMAARPGWQDQVESFGFTHAFLPNDSPLLGARAIGLASPVPRRGRHDSREAQAARRRAMAWIAP